MEVGDVLWCDEVIRCVTSKGTMLINNLMMPFLLFLVVGQLGHFHLSQISWFNEWHRQHTEP